MTESQTIEFKQYGLPKPTFEYTWTAVVATFYKIVESDEVHQKQAATKP